MCGIVGVLDPSRSRSQEDTRELLRVLSEPIVARGPDGEGVWIDESAGIGLGHRRLAILDLSEHGHQPMLSADGRYVITYNGEVYNQAELKRALEAHGSRFRGHSDTEFLVEAVSRWGVERTLDRIDGMFAFAVWDRNERVLVLARDRMGEKPLYFGRLRTGEVMFGSSLDSFRAHPSFDAGVDRDALALFFRHKYVPAPFTVYAGISKLEPGHVLRIGADGLLGDPTPYWSYLDATSRGRTYSGTPEEAADQLDDLLRQSVRRQLVADVPVGAFLSGGIDSSLIVAIAQQESSDTVRTFTIGSESSSYDEASDAARVAAHLQTDHTSLVVTAGDALRVVERLGTMYDEPFADSSQIPTFLVSQLARRDVTVALSGDGGDELFCGYNRYRWVPSIWQKASRLPSGVRKFGARAGRSIPPAAWDRASLLVPRDKRPRQLGLKVAKVLDVLDAGSPEEVFHRLVSHWPRPTELVQGSSARHTMHTDRARWPTSNNIVEHMMAIDAVTYLPDDILAKVDRASMSVGLEARVPFMNREIVEFAAGLPLRMLTEGGRSKALVRDVLARYVPRELVDRPKAGFGVPIDEWLRGPLRGWSEDRLMGDVAGHFLDRRVIERSWSDHLSGRVNNAYRLWDVLMFVEWASARGIGD